MTFYFIKSENTLEGNNLAQYIEVTDAGEVRIDVDGIMEDGRGVDKLQEMKRQIGKAIEANEEGST